MEGWVDIENATFDEQHGHLACCGHAAQAPLEPLTTPADAAQQVADAAIDSGHANAGTYFERGLFRLRRRDVPGAVDDLRRSARFDPNWQPPRDVLRSLGYSAAPP